MYKALRLKIGQQNKCPFPHTEKDGKPYYEKQASSGIDENGKFNCFVCMRGYTDQDWFTASYLNVTHNMAIKFNEMLKNSRTFLPNRAKWKTHQERLLEELKNPESEHYKYLKKLNLLDIVEDARLGLYLDNITIPSFYKGQIINLCQFRPEQTPKYINSKGALTGIITTTRRFNPELDYILITAGEKDMMLATKHGFNAISILGGEMAKPLYYKNLFIDKKIYIGYDNDEAGKKGAESLAKWLHNYSPHIKVLNIGNLYEEDSKDLSTVLKEDKEDITDFFNKYNFTDIDLWNIIHNAKWWQPPAKEHESVLELVKETKKILKKIEKEIIEK